MQNFSAEEICIFAITMWSIWNNDSESRAVVCDWFRLLTEWKNAQETRISATVQQHLKPSSVLSKPQLGRYISNVDASFSHDHNKVDIGGCIRNDQRHFVAHSLMKVDIGDFISSCGSFLDVVKATSSTILKYKTFILIVLRSFLF